MDKAVLISINPQWVSAIAVKYKTIEVRKSKPNLQTPFKAYIYCTGGKSLFRHSYKGAYLYHKDDYPFPDQVQLNYKVVGEFTCDRIYPITPFWNTPRWGYSEEYIGDGYRDCLDEDALDDYLGGKPGYGWRITNLQIYDKPKELSEFKRWNRDEDNVQCAHNYALYAPCSSCNECNLTRPPQSWCFVEELPDGSEEA